MTIINVPSDGLHPELIVLSRTVAHLKEVTREDLLSFCTINSAGSSRLSGSLTRWKSLGLFSEDDNKIRLVESFKPKRGQSIDNWTEGLPSICRELALKKENCSPLFGKNPGTSADFVRGVAWLLAQDIFSFPTTYDNSVENIESAQMKGEPIIQNDVRWNGLRFWSRYFGFATGDGRRFFIDPTAAIRDVIPKILNKTKIIPAETFMSELSGLLPVLDGGSYRLEVENSLDKTEWRAPGARQLSISLSYALRRLKLDQKIELESKADAEALILTGRYNNSLESFTHVRLIGEGP